MPKKKKPRWKCTTKPRGDCPDNCQEVFTGYGATKDDAKDDAEGKCQDEGCHTPGGKKSCNCGHTTCIKLPN
jgi:hypothetical protein